MAVLRRQVADLAPLHKADLLRVAVRASLLVVEDNHQQAKAVHLKAADLDNPRKVAGKVRAGLAAHHRAASGNVALRSISAKCKRRKPMP